MTWDGSRGAPSPPPEASPRPSGRRARSLLVAAVLTASVLAIPTIVASTAATPENPGTALIGAWRTAYRVSVAGPTDPSLAYQGRWASVPYSAVAGTSLRSAVDPGASVSLAFSGSAVAWIGPAGTDRGAASVMVDGVPVRTVDLRSGPSGSSQVLFQQTFRSVGPHVLTLVVAGGGRGAGVAVEAMVVRGAPIHGRPGLSASAATPGSSASDAPTASTPSPAPIEVPMSGSTGLPGPTLTPGATPVPSSVASPRSSAAAPPRTASAATSAPTSAPTPKPSSPATPTPKPVVTPTPTPKPAPVATPTPTPAPAVGGISVPSSIDATGATNATPGLLAFIRSVPDGSTIVFKAGTRYRLDSALEFANRRNLTFEGNGATLKSNGDALEHSSIFSLDGDSGTTIRDFNLVGNSTMPGVHDPDRQWAYGILLWGAKDTEIYRVTISATWGDCLYIGGWSDTVSFHDSHCVSSGRMGVAITSGRNVTVERDAFDTVAYGAFDIEPNAASEGASNVRFVGNTVGLINQPRGKAFLFGANGASGSSVSGITVSGNTVTRSPLDSYVNITTRRQDIAFTNNTSKVAVAGPVLEFAHIDGLTVTGNVQPLASGVLASITDCTRVTAQ